MERSMPPKSLPMFSVVIPLYNRAGIIGKTVQSVLDQTDQDFEIVIVDDGSNDNPEPVVAAFGDDRIRYIYQKNSGGSAARNNGIENSRGTYIALLDSDDLFLPEKLAVMRKEIEKFPDEKVFASYVVVDRGSGVSAIKPSRAPQPHERIDEFLFCSREVIQTSTLVVHRDTAKNVRFLEGLKKGQDIDYVLKLFNAGYHFHFIEQPLAVWVDTAYGNRISHANHAEVLEKWLRENSKYMSKKAYYGYRSNILSYEIVYKKPLIALKDLFLGMIYGEVSCKRTFHSAMRAFIPQPIYRQIVNTLLRGVDLLKVFLSYFSPQQEGK